MRAAGLLAFFAFAIAPGAEAIVRPQSGGRLGPKRIALATASTQEDTDNFIKLLQDTLAESPSVPAARNQSNQSTRQHPHLHPRKAAVGASARSAVARTSVVRTVATHSSALVHTGAAHASGALSASSILAAKAAAGAKWRSAAGDLWASLVLRNETDTVSFEDDDAETKADFLDRCNQTFDVPAFAVPDEVVTERCEKAGGSDTECSTMVDKLWTAFNGTGNVNPWCAETYNWFEKKTLPRCLGKCKAYLCNSRCTAHDKIRDLDDKETSLKFKLNQSQVREQSLELDMRMHALGKTEMEEFNRTNCTGFRDKISELEGTGAEVGEKFAEANETFTDLLGDESTGHGTLRKLYEADAPDADIERARTRLEQTLHSLSEIRQVMTSLNSRLKKIQGLLAGARARREFALKRLGELEADYRFDDEKLMEEKEKNEKRRSALEEALEKVEAQRSPYEEALAPQLENDATSTAAPEEDDAVALSAEPLDGEATDTSISDSSSEELDAEVAADLSAPVLMQTGK